MSKTAKQFGGLCLLALTVGVLAWRLWPDGGQARRQQRNRELLQAVAQNRLAATASLLNEGADPNTQTLEGSFTQKIGMYYFFVSRKMKPPNWKQLNDMNPRWSVLGVVAMQGNADMVSLLLAKGADAGYRDRAGKKALDWAEMRKGTMPPTAWKASSYSRVVTLLKAAEAKKARP